jgi:hypothetical protein
MFANRWWEIEFDVDAIVLPALPSDSIVEVGWRSIDTIYPNIRAGFEALEGTFGTIILRKQDPEATTGENSRIFDMRVGQYAEVDSVTTIADTIPNVRCEFVGGFIFPAGVVPADKREHKMELVVQPNPATVRVQVCGTELHTSSSILIHDL